MIYDFIIYSPPNTNDKIILTDRDIIKNKKDSPVDEVPRIPKGPDKPWNVSGMDYKKSDARFILTEIYFVKSDYMFKIQFKTKEYNYMIANNTLNSKFIRYFLNKYYGWHIFYPQLELDQYQIKIIDNDVSIVYIDNTNSLHFNETGYSVDK